MTLIKSLEGIKAMLKRLWVLWLFMKNQSAEVIHFLMTKMERKSKWGGWKVRWKAITFGSIGLMYRPLSSEKITFFALPAFPLRLCACCAKKRSFSSTKPPSASKTNSSGSCSCSCSLSSFSSLSSSFSSWSQTYHA